MKDTYYLFNPLELSRKDNTLCFQAVEEGQSEGKKKYLPVEGLHHLYVFGSLQANSAMYNFLGQRSISVHFFDYYEHYTGSFMPREYLLAGKMIVEQVRCYLETSRRLALARLFLEGASANILRNLRYRQGRQSDVKAHIDTIEGLTAQLPQAPGVPSLMGLEGNIRQVYYRAFNEIIRDFEMPGRSKQPPQNEINTLISFGNMLCYTLCLDQIYHTQLNPTVSFLHEPGTRRYSLALDLAEIFKPILVDRLIFTLLNRKQIQARDFDTDLKGCRLKESGRKTFVQAWNEHICTTIKHRSLNRSVSYKQLVRLECYKLAKHILCIQEYQPFKAWW
ncbi:MAG: type I-B CRISPR-associated endonuclease Cas1 [Bacteroidia bacterium]|nr:type I-B CRISPR-associated endonuclease Cas1 [Bacteroidia bacterium]